MVKLLHQSPKSKKGELKSISAQKSQLKQIITLNQDLKETGTSRMIEGGEEAK